uniref:Uncharacterized protein n=1 Tax=viral metagenome TaxID=1070528 RepID=A0A6C0CB99_9ZZZZ
MSHDLFGEELFGQSLKRKKRNATRNLKCISMLLLCSLFSCCCFIFVVSANFVFEAIHFDKILMAIILSLAFVIYYSQKYYNMFRKMD